MTALVIAIFLGAEAWPAYRWQAVRIPEELLSKAGAEGAVAKLVLSSDGSRAVVATFGERHRSTLLGAKSDGHRDFASIGFGTWDFWGTIV